MVEISDFIIKLTLFQIVILAVLTVAFVIQLVYLLYYGGLAAKKGEVLRHTRECEGVTIVVIVGEDYDYIENGLPMLLEQDYPLFEVVVVNDCGGFDVDLELNKLTRVYDNLRFTTIKRDELFNHSRKTPLNIGIKAAKYDRIIITHTNALPTNERWLESMARGFNGADLVIGYTGLDVKKGIVNALLRSSRMASSVRYLRAAQATKPYKGIYNNIGFTKGIYMQVKGYSHLRMTLGEDDLFVQKIAGHCGTGVVVNPRATLRQSTCGGIGWWFAEQRYRTSSFRLYPMAVRLRTFFDLASRALFFISTVAAVLFFSDYYLWGGVILLLIIRELVFMITSRRIAKRLCEIKIMWGYFIYDKIAPLSEAILCISRRLSPPRMIWIQNQK